MYGFAPLAKLPLSATELGVTPNNAALTGAGIGGSIGAGLLGLVVAFSGAGTGKSTASGSLQLLAGTQLVGQGNGTSTGQGAMTQTVALSGAGLGASSGNGNLLVPQALPLSGAGAGVGTGLGSLLLGTGTQLVGAGAGALMGQGNLSLSTFIAGNAHVIHLPNRAAVYVGNPPPYVLKRTSDTLLLDLDCTNLLGAGEVITSGAIPAPGSTLTAGPVSVNPSAQTYPGYVVAPAGAVAQFTIAGGTIPAGAQYLDVVLRPALTTTFTEILEATIVVRLQDLPPLV